MNMAYEGMSPSVGQRNFGGFTPVEQLSTPEPPTITSDEEFVMESEDRKASIARGEGYRRTEVPLPTLSGENIYLQNASGEFVPCRRCGTVPCVALRYIFEDEVRLKCTICGKGMKMGLTEVGARENQTFQEGWDRAETNRRRAWREEEAERSESIDKDIGYMREAKPFVVDQFLQ